MRIQFATQTDVGTRKPINQDSYLIKSIKSENYQMHLVVLCDGMGGMQQGEKASRQVVDAFRLWFENNASRYQGENIYTRMCLLKDIKKVLKDANHDILNYGRMNRKNLGTTASVLLLINGKYYIFHVGDTRIYKYNTILHQLTQDHTVANMKKKQNVLSEEQIRMGADKHILYQCIGMAESIKIQFNKGRIRNGDTFFLCCDGMYHLFAEKELERYVATLRRKDPEVMKRIVRDMIRLVQSKGETDNITAVVVDVLEV